MYPLSIKVKNVHSEFNVEYFTDWRTGNRLVNCKTSDDYNKKILFVGDSFVFGVGHNVEDSFVHLFDCANDFQVLNVGVSGAGLAEYKEIIKIQNYKDIKYVYLIFYDNDADIDTNRNTILKRIKDYLKYQSFNYTLLKTFKNYIYTHFIDDQKKIHYLDGKINNLYSVIKHDPLVLKKWFKLDKQRKLKIEHQISEITKFLKKNSKAELVVMVIPEVSVLSKKHRKFYKSLGVNYLPKLLEKSKLSNYIELLSSKYDYKYLPFYEHLINLYKSNDEDLYFNTDFHFNKKGNVEMNNFLISNFKK